MKILFFLIVIANVALFLWEYRHGAVAPSPDDNQRPGIVSEEPLRLLSELTPAPSPIEKPAAITATPQQPAITPTAPAAIAAAEPKPVAHCYEAGPFRQPAQYQQWLSALTEDYALTPILKDADTPARYIVALPAGTPKETDANVQLLKQQGVSDYFMHRPEQGGKLISLGIFSSEQRATVLKKQMLALGINPIVKIEYRLAQQRFLAIKTDDQQGGALVRMRKNYPDITVKDRACQ